jgi:hypothetical protein
VSDLSYLNVSLKRAKIVCTCGWESDEFSKSPFDPNEALVAYSVEHLKCTGSRRPSDSIRIWSWNLAPQNLKDLISADGDEDGIAWIPAKFRTDYGYDPSVDRIWQSVDDSPEIVELDDGVLVVWRHS